MFERMEKLQLVWLAVILALGLILAVRTGASSVSKDTITVTGSAYSNVKSDSAMTEFEIQAKKPDKQSAYAVIKTQLPAVNKYLEEKGITDIDILTPRGYYTYKYNANGSMTNEIAFYNLSQPVVIKSKDVNKIKEISVDIQNLVQQGIDINVNNTEYYYSKLSDLKIQLLKSATTDAKARASAMLKATNNRPGKIQSVQMGVFQITPPDSTNVSDMGINDTSTIDKKVTAVANVVFYVK